jgi:maleylacetate reductase
MHTVLLPYVLSLNLSVSLTVYGGLARALGASDPLEGLLLLYEQVGMPRSLGDIGLREEDLPAAVEAATARLPIENPVTVDADVLGAILGAAIRGDDPRDLRR